MVIEGETKSETPFQMVKATLPAGVPSDSVIACHDNSSAIRGYECDAPTPGSVDEPRQGGRRTEDPPPHPRKRDGRLPFVGGGACEGFRSGARTELEKGAPVTEEGRAASEKIDNERGLGFDDFDLDFYTELFKVSLRLVLSL